MRTTATTRVVVAAIAVALASAGCTGATDQAPTTEEQTMAYQPTPASTETPTAEAATLEAALSDPTHGLTAFYDAGSQADDVLGTLRAQGDTEAAALIERIAAQPIATWLGDRTPALAERVGAITSEAAAANQIALFVIYNIPGRDCGLYSAGGAEQDEYLGWVQTIADAVDPASTTWFILEPDALAQLGDCDGQGDRVGLLAGAARILDEAGGEVFLDVGNSRWRTPETMAERVALVGTEHLAGFETNTSNYVSTEEEAAWGERLQALTGLPFITDTSRNGNGATADSEWCNPRGRALGAPPQVNPGTGQLALVWAKVPGESDGECNGGPAAGVWWQEIAEELARDASM